MQANEKLDPQPFQSAHGKKIAFQEKDYRYYNFPKVSIIIPTYNCSQSIALTLESVLSQEYSDFEVIVIDANSRDRTMQVIKSFYDKRVRIYSVTTFNRYEMLNKGISLAKGAYVNFLFPGDFYIYSNTLQDVMSLALDYDQPHLVYGACLLRDGISEVKMLYRPLSLSILKNGQQPTTLQSCWLRLDLFRMIGKFCPDYHLRGGFDLFCRFSINGTLKWISTTRVLTDYDLRGVTRQMVFHHFLDSVHIIHAHFGLKETLKWMLFQKDTARLMRLWWRSLKLAFVGQRK